MVLPHIYCHSLQWQLFALVFRRCQSDPGGTCCWPARDTRKSWFLDFQTLHKVGDNINPFACEWERPLPEYRPALLARAEAERQQALAAWEGGLKH